MRAQVFYAYLVIDNRAIVTSLTPLYARPYFNENRISRQIAKNRHIATPGTSWMQDLLEMIPMQYHKNRFIIVREVAFWKKVYELGK